MVTSASPLETPSVNVNNGEVIKTSLKKPHWLCCAWHSLASGSWPRDAEPSVAAPELCPTEGAQGSFRALPGLGRSSDRGMLEARLPNLTDTHAAQTFAEALGYSRPLSVPNGREQFTVPSARVPWPWPVQGS